MLNMKKILGAMITAALTTVASCMARDLYYKYADKIVKSDKSKRKIRFLYVNKLKTNRF